MFFLSWGVIGHRTVGMIAQKHLTDKAKAAVKELLGDTSLADVSTWADEVRSKPAYEQTAPWHDLYVPLGLNYNEFVNNVKNITQDNVYSALQKNEAILLDKNTTRIQKKEALKFVVHFVGDLHQPLHVGRFEDDGGTDIKVNIDGKTQSLHHVWDTYLLERQGLGYEQLAEKYDDATARQIKEWQSDSLMQWLWESYQISTRIYANIDTMKIRSLDSVYYKSNIGIVNERLEKAGIRLAGVLNKLFVNGLTPSKGE
jgi:hypothetical protein